MPNWVYFILNTAENSKHFQSRGFILLNSLSKVTLGAGEGWIGGRAAEKKENSSCYYHSPYKKG